MIAKVLRSLFKGKGKPKCGSGEGRDVCQSETEIFERNNDAKVKDYAEDGAKYHKKYMKKGK